MKGYKIFGIVIPLIILGCVLVFGTTIPKEKVEKEGILRALIGGQTVSLEIADTDEERSKGLSGHVPLEVDEGMLFVFPVSGPYGFWMKDMTFPIDIVWLDEMYRIVYVKEQATPESYPQVFAPGVPARYVVELSSGFFAKNHLHAGNIVEILR
jgi:uncharacterized membrane protein (UPF0127 family)